MIVGCLPVLSVMPPNSIRAERISVIPMIPRLGNLGITDKGDSNVNGVAEGNDLGCVILVVPVLR